MLAAVLTPANTADNEAAPSLIQELPPEMCFLLSDRHYNVPNMREECELRDYVMA